MGMGGGPRGMGGMMNEPQKKLSLREQWAILKEFVSYYPRHKFLLSLDLTVVILSPLVSTLMPLLVYRALQDYLPGRNAKMLALSLAALLALTLCRILFEYIITRWGHTLGVRMEADMRADLFAHVQKLSFTYFDRTKTGHIMSRITNDLSMIAEIAHHCPEDIISAVLMLCGGLGVMFWINPALALLSLVPVPFMILWTGVLQRKMHRNFVRVRQEIAEISSRVENSIQGIREVKSYTNEQHEIRKFAEVNGHFRTARENVFSLLAVFHSGMMFFLNGYTVLFIGLGVLLIFLGKADAPQLITFFMYSGQISMPVMRLAGFVEQYQQGLAAFGRFHEIMMEQPDITDPPDAPETWESPVRGEIVFDHVSFRYAPDADGKERENVLKDVSLTVPAGSTLAVVGASGAGKTTLAALIPRFYDVCAGSVRIDGRDVREFRQKALRSRIGIVQQTPFLFDMTIRENILFGRPDASEKELIQAAEHANILEFIRTLPEGFDSRCGENGVRLSGGQKQRISIARIFLKDPAILIFDEATSSLDNQSELLVQESMERLCADRTTILIAHRLSTIRNADFICCMKNGEIVERGTHEELLALNGYYKQLYTMHSF